MQNRSVPYSYSFVKGGKSINSQLLAFFCPKYLQIKANHRTFIFHQNFFLMFLGVLPVYGNCTMNKILKLICVCSIGSFSTQVSAETLRDSVSSALKTHPSVEAAFATSEANSESVKEERSAYLPSISLGATAGRGYLDNSTSRGLTTSRGAAYSWIWEGNASVTQSIYNAGEVNNRVMAAQARTDASQLTVIDTQENLALQATQSYIGVLRASDVLRTALVHKQEVTDYLGRIQVMVDEGVADESEIAQAKSLELQLQNIIIDFEGQREAALAQYLQIVGRLPQGLMERPVAVADLMDSSVDAAAARAKQNHPLILASLKEMRAADYSLDAEKSGAYPTVDGELSHLQRDQREEVGGELRDTRAVLRMNWGFETGGAQKARENRARAEYKEIMARQKETARQIEGDIRRAYSEYETSKKQLAVLKEREEIAQDLMEAYEAQFEGARVRLLQLMQTKNQLFSAKLETLNAEYRYLAAQYATLASTGKLHRSFSLASK